MNKKIVMILALAGIVAGGVSTHYMDNASHHSNKTKIENTVLLAQRNVTGTVCNLDGYPYLHVRAQGDEYSNILKDLPSGTQVNVLGEAGGWYHINVDGVTGWVYSNYLSVNGSTPGQNTHVSVAYSNQYGTVGNLDGYPHLHMRSNGTTGAPIIKDLANGTKVQILGEDGGWYRINVSGTTGWVYSLYINKDGSGNVSSNTNITSNQTIKTSSTTNSSIGTVANLDGYPYLHVRAQGDEYSSILKDLPSGTQVNVLGEAGGWYHINVDGVTGWVYSNYLSVNGSMPGQNTHVNVAYSNQYGTVGNLDGYPHLHMRSNGTIGAPIIKDLANGTKVQVLGESGGWYRINAGGTTGWVYSLYINM
ncbi:MAG: SH3 domain-containing protein [Sarcina sp.]